MTYLEHVVKVCEPASKRESRQCKPVICLEPLGSASHQRSFAPHAPCRSHESSHAGAGPSETTGR